VLSTPPVPTSTLPGESAAAASAHPSERLRALRWVARVCVHLLLAGAGVLVGAGVLYEMRTSALQARIFSDVSSRLTYEVANGPSPRTVFPYSGPFDQQRGYSALPEFQWRLQARGFRIARQARVSPQLAELAAWGIVPPYPEPPFAGLTILGLGGTPLYDRTGGGRLFEQFEDVPPLIVQALLFIENRELLTPLDPRSNPVIEWDRLAKATLLYAGGKLGLPVPVQGGSTLATQLEKYRHSPRGRTGGLAEKLRQMIGASLKAYHDGPDTRAARRQIVVDYLNTLPLSAAPGFGELYGLGEGLYAWFGLQLSDVSAALSAPLSDPPPAATVQAFKHVLALLVAVRAPTTYLVESRGSLDTLVNESTRRLAKEGIIGSAFAAAVVATPITFLPHAPISPPVSFVVQKAPNAVRTNLTELLGTSSLYDLDRLHLDVDSTVDMRLQEDITALFRDLGDRGFVSAHGLKGEHLLRSGDPSKVLYSLVLYERTPGANLLRVQADSLDRPFDINDGIKMELGSTAKLRTLAHYLELVAALHDELAPLDGGALQQRARDARDPITRWAAETLRAEPGLDLEAFLQRALDRRYSANPGDQFFTGGGIHVFGNFERADNGRIMPLREGLQRSVNLVFIRLMRDLVRFHQARLPYDAEAILNDQDDPERQQLLTSIADGEAKHSLAQAYRTYRGHPSPEVVDMLLGRRAESPRHLAMLFFAWHPGADEAGLREWLTQTRKKVASEDLRRLYRAYGNPRLTLADYAWLLGRPPLDVWCAGELVRDPTASWKDLVERSVAARRVASAWLFKTRNRHAQDLRLRIRIEKDAFARMTPYWKRLAFPFERLVPSYATAIGNSSDRPAALAELMGIIVNDGVRLPSLRVTQLHFAAGTPYDTVFTPAPEAGERVMDPAVARALRGVLANVVQKGTARRVAGAFVSADGTPVIAGGKTGSGDNRYKTFTRYGGVTSARPVNRTATFVFYVGDRYFGVLTAFVPGRDAGNYEFTSALPLSVLKLAAPAINKRL
jgi:membrane peptidoglycan carboxypeptidase